MAVGEGGRMGGGGGERRRDFFRYLNVTIQKHNNRDQMFVSWKIHVCEHSDCSLVFRQLP